MRTQGYCTDVFFGQALKWIEAVKDRQPFLAWIALHAPHGPLQVRPEDEASYTGAVANPNAAKFFGMIANIDDNVGRLLAQLDAWNLTRETLVIFMNDNGTAGGTLANYNAGMRGTKSTAWLGGTRASSFWRWPGTLPPADCGVLAAHIDFFPTIAELAGATLSPEMRRQVEGRSLVPLLKHPDGSLPEYVQFTHLGRWPKGTDPNEWKFAMCSIRDPRWQLMSPDGGREPKWQLFDVLTYYG